MNPDNVEALLASLNGTNMYIDFNMICREVMEFFGSPDAIVPATPGAKIELEMYTQEAWRVIRQACKAHEAFLREILNRADEKLSHLMVKHVLWRISNLRENLYPRLKGDPIEKRKQQQLAVQIHLRFAEKKIKKFGKLDPLDSRVGQLDYEIFSHFREALSKTKEGSRTRQAIQRKIGEAHLCLADMYVEKFNKLNMTDPKRADIAKKVEDHLALVGQTIEFRYALATCMALGIARLPRLAGGGPLSPQHMKRSIVDQTTSPGPSG